MSASEKQVVILGSSGSIGKSTVDVISDLEGYNIFGIVIDSNLEELEKQLKTHSPKYVVINNEESYERFHASFGSFPGTVFLKNKDAVVELVSKPEVDIVVNGISGIPGLVPTVEALKAGKTVATANKESIIMGWEYIKDSMKFKNQLLPVDSEHSAIFQCLQGENENSVEKLILTASGGAVYRRSREELEIIPSSECLRHPKWNMGPKITIDSATLMNKGLEVIEASNLFDIALDKIEVFIHPQSIIHGMVEYIDGTVTACLADQDMKLPIQYALTYPERKKSKVNKLSLDNISTLKFKEPDTERFRCLSLALRAGKEGVSQIIKLCAADEVAVNAYLENKIGFFQIAELIETVLDYEISIAVNDVDSIEELYSGAKKISNDLLGGLKEQ